MTSGFTWLIFASYIGFDLGIKLILICITFIFPFKSFPSHFQFYQIQEKKKMSKRGWLFCNSEKGQKEGWRWWERWREIWWGRRWEGWGGGRREERKGKTSRTTKEKGKNIESTTFVHLSVFVCLSSQMFFTVLCGGMFKQWVAESQISVGFFLHFYSDKFEFF